ncbi:tail fiber domain-containing protein [Halobacteriovorax sp. YZS-1-1]|uniref:tail fiber domain-containing protein n=1 Tax=unclassified Halobacteriovorax TaxID=2639665 RepID=UPI003999E9F9
MNYKKRNNEFGFTLVEIMVAAGLLGVLSVALVNMISNINRTSKRASQVFNVQQEIQRISTLLADQDSCFATFNGESFGSTAQGADFNFNTISRVDGAGVASNIYTLNQELGGADGKVHLESLSATITSNAPGPSYMQAGVSVVKVDANIRVQFEKGGPTASIEAVRNSSIGQTIITRDIPVSFVLNEANGNVVSCYGANSQYTDAVCDAFGGEVDADGRCTQVQLRSRSAGTLEIDVPLDYSAEVGSNTAAALTGETSTRVPLRIHRGGSNSMRFDENTIQTSGANLELNPHARNIIVGNSGTNVDIRSTVVNTLNVSAATTHTGTTNFNNTATFDALADFNSTVYFDNSNTYFRQGMTLSASQTFILQDAARIRFTGSSHMYFDSDESLKHDINEIEDVLSKFDEIRGVEFVWNKNNRRDIGYIAQDIEKVFPDLVTTTKEGTKSVQYTKMTAVNTAGIKALRAENQELKFRVNLLMKALCEGEDAYKYEDVCALPLAPLE